MRGNAWRVETDVRVTGGTRSSVEAMVGDGPRVPLEQQRGGSWAESVHAPPGETVRLIARATDNGGSDASETYVWPPG